MFDSWSVLKKNWHLRDWNTFHTTGTLNDSDICNFSKVSDYNGGLWEFFFLPWKLFKVFLLIQQRFVGNI